MPHIHFDISKFYAFPPQQSPHATPRLSINEKGALTMNGAFLKQVGTVRDFKGMYSEDGSQILLFPEEEPNIRFSKCGGLARNQLLANILKELGYGFPALYTMEWSEEYGAWVGSTQEMAPPPEFSAVGKPKRSRKTRREA